MTTETLEFPSLATFRTVNGGLWAACDHCLRWHEHSNDVGEGHRVAHCDDPRSPYYADGYLLDVRGDLDADVTDHYQHAWDLARDSVPERRPV